MMIIRSIFTALISFFILGCMEPNKENLWKLDSVAHLKTEGYCRDVFISGDSVFIAAGQAGIQLWDISSIVSPKIIWDMTLTEIGANKEISQIEYEPSIKQLFILESNERPIHIDLSRGDSSPIVLGQFSSEKTKEFRVITNNSDSFTAFAADNDDGLKWSRFDYDTTFGIWFNSAGGEITSRGNPNGIDIYGSSLILTLDQLGIELYQNNLEILSSRIHKDLDGNARSVKMISEQEFYIACEDGGAYRLFLSNSLEWQYMVQFAKDLFVTHVSSNNDQISLSCASNGLALYESKQNGQVEERGIHDIGYVYHTEFSNDYLFAATRDGLQILMILE